MSRRSMMLASLAGALMSSAPVANAGPATQPRRRPRGATHAGTYRNGDSVNKRALIAAAREEGWTGKSFRTAKKFAKRIRLTEPDTARRLALAFNRHRLGGAR